MMSAVRYPLWAIDESIRQKASDQIPDQKSSIKQNMKKYFVDDFLSADFWQKKNPHEHFPKNQSSRRLESYSPYLADSAVLDLTLKVSSAWMTV